MPMKPNVLFVFILSLILFSGLNSCTSHGASTENSVVCSPNMVFPEDHGKAQKHSLVFIDLTDSSIFGESAQEYLRKVMESRLSTAEDKRPDSQQKADKLQVFFITANTATTQTISATNLDLRTTPLGNLTVGQTIINSSKKTRYTCQLQDFVNSNLLNITDKVKSAQTQNADVNSDVLGLFFLAEREFKRSTAEDKAIFVISDMEQFCQNGGYFECESTRICSSGCKGVQAKGDASQDAKRIRQKLGGKLALNGAGFHYMRGDRKIGNTNQGVLNFIQDYWSELSGELGLKPYNHIH